MGFPAKGEGGILQAAKNGGITEVGTVDIRVDYPVSPAFAAFYHINNNSCNRRIKIHGTFEI